MSIAATEANQTSKVKNLVAQHIQLNGIHLIEASAGTGKTYNITRIYLRLLLEQQLTVQQILVMTFTKDATEELRGRIDSFIRLAINQWQELKQSDEYFKAIAEKIDDQQAMLCLQQALLYLDEAAIFTIHGFCKRVLTQYAFESGISFNAQMEGQQQALVVQAVQDWYRQLASDEAAFNQVVTFWPTPMSFISDFSKAINQTTQLQLDDSEQLINDFYQRVEAAIKSLTAHKVFVFSQLVEGKAPAEQGKRSEEYQRLIQWLTDVSQAYQQIERPMPDAFIDGRRYARAKAKAELSDIFAPVNAVKQAAKTLLSEVAKREALAIVKCGIEQVRAQVSQDKQQQNLLTFDDLVTTLAEHLSSENGRTLANSLFAQYPYALIDEFQDTDPAQLKIVRAMYYHRDHGALFMIGDPKQAIYGFRGGDIFAYMSARNACDSHWIMDTNWRSSQAMINGYNRLFYGNALHLAPADVFRFNIPYHPVKASPGAIEQASQTEGQHSALQFVHFAPALEHKAYVAQSYRSEMATWCANEIVTLLSDKQANIQAKDIALLVRDSTEANEIKQALFNAGVASVYLSNRANLLHSEQTGQLLQLLKGILFLENERLFCASLASALLPYRAQNLYQLQQNDLAWQEMKMAFSHLRALWLKKGFITMALHLLHEHLVICGEDSERSLTNILHLFELLQTASQRHRQPQELLHWFEQQCTAEFPDLESELRLESEENLIRIITQHGSKGLEYPIVFVPFASRHKDPLKFGRRELSLIEYHDANGELVVSLSGSEQAKNAMRDEAYAETIRLLYVAVTRAEQKCYLLTTGFEHAHLSPIGLTCGWDSDCDIEQQLNQLAVDQPQSISVTLIKAPVQPIRFTESQTEQNNVNVAQFNGKIERDWWLSSFTALSRNIRDNGVSSPVRENQLELDVVEAPRAITHESSNLLRFALTKGANTGNLLHYIFEHLNFAQPEWPQLFKWALLKYGELPQGFSQTDFIHWLQQILATPLLASDRQFCLGALTHERVLKEVEFYFPLKNANVRALSQLLIAHRKQTTSGDKSVQPLGAQQLSISFHRHLKGMMHGFIDLIFEHQGKYYVCDYKSNHLGNAYQDYHVDKLKADIETHHYDLQYLIYSLALHRHLKVALEDYQAEQHFGGVFYLYLRGMEPQSINQHTGVYYRAITANELNELDRIFAGDLHNQTHQPAEREQIES